MGDEVRARRPVLGTALAGVALVLLAAACGGPATGARTAASDPATSSAPASTASAPASATTSTSPAPTTTTVTATAPTSPASEPVAPAGFDPPADQPLTIVISGPDQAAAGSIVSFHVRATDPDAPVTDNCGSHSVSPPPSDDPQIGFACSIARHEGPATTTPQPGSYEIDLPYRFDGPGTYTLTVQLASGDPDSPGDRSANAYADVTTASFAITIT